MNKNNKCCVQFLYSNLQSKLEYNNFKFVLLRFTYFLFFKFLNLIKNNSDIYNMFHKLCNIFLQK